WGEGRLEAARDALVARHILHPGVSYYDQLHSDMIDTAARRGVLGLLGVALLYGVPLYLFSRRLGASSPGVRILAMAGLMTPLAFIVFGLSQSMLRDVHGLSGYLGLSIGCWVIMKREEQCALCQESERADRRYVADAFVGERR
ncbi:MAG: O-antigen ligase family protein, partial [Onishia taeanensis]